MSMIEIRQKMTELVSNPAELTGNIYFEEWLEVMYGDNFKYLPMCGLDFADLFKAAQGRTGALKCFEFKQTKEFREQLFKDVNYHSNAVIAAIKIPESIEDGLGIVHQVAEAIMDSVNSGSNVLWQARRHNRDKIKVILLELEGVELP